MIFVRPFEWHFLLVGAHGIDRNMNKGFEFEFAYDFFSMMSAYLCVMTHYVKIIAATLF